ncbi:hypothetical protein PPSIR1_21179 [Plesiocystis pacifica SIR-1]|uniref:Uncharacterized protein n=1 Tax=Plesiocystis pacifica SIR-1 TaxID=391625 RepID=A6G3H5_9BACT|nr:hypothetical protein PPSIR1_21179 [Plesiocystis pacifica SIR-1]
MVRSADFIPLLEQAQRRAIVAVLRGHPRWTLGDLLEHIERSGPRASALRGLRLEELQGCRARSIPRSVDDLRRLEQARHVAGAEFDELVRAVLLEARAVSPGGWVSAGHVRERVGGPRWKLLGSFTRLVEAGLAERKGKTSSTRYRALDSGGAP